jgi:hypothetical protein
VVEKLLTLFLCIIYLLARDLEGNWYFSILLSNMSSVISSDENASHVLHEMIMQLIYYDSKLKLMKNPLNEDILMVKVIP